MGFEFHYPILRSEKLDYSVTSRLCFTGSSMLCGTSLVRLCLDMLLLLKIDYYILADSKVGESGVHVFFLLLSVSYMKLFHSQKHKKMIIKYFEDVTI